MKKRTRRKFKIFIFILSVIILIGLGVFLLCSYVLDVKTRTVIMHGNSIVSDDEILEIADIIDYPNFFLTNTKNIERKLEKDVFIKNVEVKRDLLLQFHIYIEENKPLFIREDTNMIVFDKNNEVKNNVSKDLDVPYLINYVPNTKYDDLIKKLKQINYGLLKRVSQIKYEPTKYDEDRFILYMNDSNRVYINLPKFKNFNDYDKMVVKFEGKTGKLYLDSGNYFEIDK
ncbi:MAG: FtsQ-type POTRA domain-containing protein [Bacilli bacterium]|nr:FtsQ-type POTRA domain-containing protein [Bacilli bacterium]